MAVKFQSDTIIPKDFTRFGGKMPVYLMNRGPSYQINQAKILLIYKRKHTNSVFYGMFCSCVSEWLLTWILRGIHPVEGFLVVM